MVRLTRSLQGKDPAQCASHIHYKWKTLHGATHTFITSGRPCTVCLAHSLQVEDPATPLHFAMCEMAKLALFKDVTSQF